MEPEPVPDAPRQSLSRLVQDLGSTVLRVACEPTTGPDPDVSSTVIFDVMDELSPQPGALLLGVGISGTAQTCELLDSMGRRGLAGLVLKAPVDVESPLQEVVERNEIPVLELVRAASWSNVAALARAWIEEADVTHQANDPQLDVHHTDLFGLANSISALLDAPITIEDRSFRVLAYSRHQEDTDPARVATVLGREVPEQYRRLLIEHDVLRHLYREEQPLYVELGAGFLPRLTVAIRSQDEILGSIWAIVKQPADAQMRRTFLQASRIVALQLLRQRAGADVGRRLRTDLLATVLSGGNMAADAASRLGIKDSVSAVLAVEPLRCTGETRDALAERMADALSVHLGAIRSTSASALIAGVAYGVLPINSADAAGMTLARSVAHNFLSRIGGRIPVNVGIGRPALGLRDLSRSRKDADAALRVLRTKGAACHVATWPDDVFPEFLLLQMRDLADAEELCLCGTLSSLYAYDSEHNGDLVHTLSAYLEAFGDINRAASAINVHPNTFRYRLRRLCEVGELDLTDSDALLSSWIQLRIHVR